MESSSTLLSGPYTAYGAASTLIGLGMLLITTTYIFNIIRISLAARQKDGPQEPLPIPYLVPVLGNLIPWMIDSHEFLIKLTKKYGYSPFRLRLGQHKMHFVSKPEDIAAFFRTHGVGASHEFTLMAITVFFGMPEAVVKSAYARDNSGIAPKPLPGTNVPPEKRFFYLHHRLVLKELSGRSLNQMTARFLESQQRRFANENIGEDWTHIPDLFSWLEHVVFQASVESLAGTKIFEVIPNLMKEYRDFYDAAPAILRGLPRIFSPKAFKARDTLVASLKKWHIEAQKHNPLKPFDTEDQGWDEWWGTQFVKQRKALVLAMDGMTLDGMASDDLALLLTTNVNAIPSAAWLIIDVMRNSSLFERVMPDVTSAFEAGPDGKKQLNIVKLCNSPLLQSIYAETLRMRTSNMLPRVMNTGEQPLKNWTFPKKSAVFVLGNVAAFDGKVWNTGSVDQPRPLDEFWADRFLKYPDDPTSGPLRNPAPEPEKPELSAVTKSNEPKFTTSGLDGAWIPYGGGINMCPGRHFAKQELIGTFAMLVSQFEMEILTPPEVKIEPNTGFRIFGTMPPKGKIEARIRRRRVPLDS